MLNESVVSRKRLFLSWWRSSICRSSASSFLWNTQETQKQADCVSPQFICSICAQDNILQEQKAFADRTGSDLLSPHIFSGPRWQRGRVFNLPGAPSETGPASLGPACGLWWPPSGHQAPQSHWGCHWWAGGSSGSEQLLCASLKNHRRSLDGGDTAHVTVRYTWQVNCLHWHMLWTCPS